jgi:hypothetical protein
MVCRYGQPATASIFHRMDTLTVILGVLESQLDGSDIGNSASEMSGGAAKRAHLDSVVMRPPSQWKRGRSRPLNMTDRLCGRIEARQAGPQRGQLHGHGGGFNSVRRGHDGRLCATV